MGKNPREETIAVGDVKSHFSELLDRVRQESVIVTITRHGRPVARLVPVDLVTTSPHLAEARGWLDDDDPFFRQLDRVVADRAKHKPRRVDLGR